MSPIFAIPGLALCAIGYWLGQVYMRAQLAVKRERSNARAPVLGHFSTAIQGVGHTAPRIISAKNLTGDLIDTLELLSHSTISTAWNGFNNIWRLIKNRSLRPKEYRRHTGLQAAT
ncbi:hypothetical protein EIP86_003488 [Pleurotus ostreatoroseus]|nr:hypothetical protein EIP86_003488 [Pleurotus ostreatoroseus]